nr:retrovirus-related Pol polyprotein from transposon TNT 1-94 [Tanacetum cinerariifolium]
MANVPLNDPNVDASAIVHDHVNPDHASAQPVGLGNGFVPHWIGDNIPNNQNGWIEEDAEEDPKEDPEEDLEEEPEDDDDDMEIDDEAEEIDPYMDDGSNNPPPPNSKDKETPPTSPSKGSFPLDLGLQVREPPAELSARPVPAPYPDDPYYRVVQAPQGIGCKLFSGRYWSRGIVNDIVMRDHLKRNCSKNNRKKSPGYVKKDVQPNSSGSTYDDYEVMVVMSAQALLDWIMNSGCSYHMLPRLDILFDFIECDQGSVQLGENREYKIRGIGKVRVQLKDGSSFVLHNVTYIPELKRNLISLESLKKEVYTVKLQSGKLKVINGSKVFLSRIPMNNCVYSLDGHVVAGKLNVSVEEKDSLGFKHEAFGKFKEWKQLVENQTGRMVKKLGTDNGLEFRNQDFEQLCIESGIAKNLSSGLPKTFWVEATYTVAYLINRSPTREIEKKKPMEMWSGHPSNYEMLRIFGRVTYPHDKQGVDKSVEESQVKVELQRLNNHTLKKDKTDQEDGDDKYAGDHEIDQPPDLTDYQLVRDREPRTRTKLFRDGFSKEERDLGVSRSSSWVKSAFLHGNLEEVIYMRQPPGYEQDDMLIACKSKAEIGSTKSLLKKEFNMKELGEAKKILDNEKSVQMPLGGHFKLSLKDCPVKDCDVERMSKMPYANVDGVHEARHSVYYHGNHVDVKGFVDSDYAKDPDKEAEYMALTEAVKEAIWLRGLLEELGVELNTLAVNCDKQGAIHLSLNHVFFMKGLSTSMRVITLSKRSLKQRRLKF